MKTIAVVGALVLGLVASAIAGDVTGKVSFAGKAPAMPKIRMDADRYCRSSHKTPVESQEVVVNKNGTLKYVLVYVKDGLGGKKFTAPDKTAIFDQIGCMYDPHVFAVQVGQKVEILNSDNTLHNVHTLSTKNQSFNAGQPIKGSKLMKTFDKPELFHVKCDVHSWMSAYFGVFDNPYFAVTGDDGTFTIKGLPAGTYTIEAWHEKYGTQTMTVTVGATGSKTADFKFAAK